MAQIGTVGNTDIPIFEEGDISDPILYAKDNGQWGVVSMVRLYHVDETPHITVKRNGNWYGSIDTANRIIDDFEDGSLSEYTVLSDSGDARVFSKSYNGSKSLRMEGFQRVWTFNGRPVYPSAGNTIKFYINWSQLDEGTRFLYGMQKAHSNEEHYQLWLYPYDVGTFRVLRRDGNANTHTIATQEGFGISEDTWYECLIHWQSPDYSQDHVIQFRELNGSKSWQISGNDSMYTDGGYGFRSAGNMTYFVDDLQLTR